MSVAYLDTHVAVFLHDGLLEELSSEAKRQIEASDLLISPMVFLELEYLFERQRITVDAKEMFTILSNDFGRLDVRSSVREGCMGGLGRDVDVGSV